jgi:GntR family transcriptional regulator
MTADRNFVADAGPDSAEPVIEYLYVTVAKRITRGIQATQMRPGQQLPPMTEIAATFKVSGGTVRQALKLLEQEGVVICMRGRGTFVRRQSDVRK